MHEQQYQNLKKELDILISSSGLIPGPFQKEFPWPGWAINDLFNPERGNRQRYKLFVFLWRNSNGHPDNIGEFLMFWIRKVPAFIKNVDSQTRHYEQMIRETKSRDPKLLLRYYKSDWWSIVERKLIPGVKSLEELQAQNVDPALIPLPDNEEDLYLAAATKDAEDEYMERQRQLAYNEEDEAIHEAALRAEQEHANLIAEREAERNRLTGGRLRGVVWTKDGPIIMKRYKRSPN